MTGKRNIPLKMTRRHLLATAGKGALAGGALLAGSSLWPRAARAAGEVNVLAFGGYEEPGMLEPFEQSTGIEVNLKIHDGSDEEMVALIASSPPGTFDVITPTSADTPRVRRALHERGRNHLSPDRQSPGATRRRPGPWAPRGCVRSWRLCCRRAGSRSWRP